MSKSMKLWAMPRRGTQDGRVMVENSDKMWSTGEGSGKPLQYSCLENPMNSMKRQNYRTLMEKTMAPHSSTLVWKIPWMEDPGGLQSMGVAKSQTRLSNFTFTFHFHSLEKELATHSSVLAWRIPETGEPGGLTSMRSHRVGHDWSDLTAAAA